MAISSLNGFHEKRVGLPLPFFAFTVGGVVAGDWIKIVKGCGQKPETVKIARMLGVSRREAYGILVEFFEWLDGNCVDGVVDGVVDADVDDVMSCPGLSALLKAVGWARFEVDPPRMLVVHFDRHNGETSKNRALKSERQAKWRAKSVDGLVDALPSTREEKRREEKKEPKPKTLKTGHRNGSERASRLPQGWHLPDEWRDWAKAIRPDWTPQGIVRESLTFRDYWHAKAGNDACKVDWLATWRNWIRRAESEPTR